jgi:potassium-dependent mechanosensitive channel
VINWTLTNNNRQIELIVGVAYGTDVAKVDTILRNIVNNREDILKAPAPAVFLHNFSDSSVDFRMLFWAADISNWTTLKSKVMGEVYTQFTKEGIEIPHPKRDIQVYFPTGTMPEDISKMQKPTENPPGEAQ